jgi:hypothetical protein
MKEVGVGKKTAAGYGFWVVQEAEQKQAPTRSDHDSVG